MFYLSILNPNVLFLIGVAILVILVKTESKNKNIWIIATAAIILFNPIVKLNFLGMRVVGTDPPKPKTILEKGVNYVSPYYKWEGETLSIYIDKELIGKFNQFQRKIIASRIEQAFANDGRRGITNLYIGGAFVDADGILQPRYGKTIDVEKPAMVFADANLTDTVFQPGFGVVEIPNLKIEFDGSIVKLYGKGECFLKIGKGWDKFDPTIYEGQT